MIFHEIKCPLLALVKYLAFEEALSKFYLNWIVCPQGSSGNSVLSVSIDGDSSDEFVISTVNHSNGNCNAFPESFVNV